MEGRRAPQRHTCSMERGRNLSNYGRKGHRVARIAQAPWLLSSRPRQGPARSPGPWRRLGAEAPGLWVCCPPIPACILRYGWYNHACCGVASLGDGVTGNTPDSGSGKRRFESSSPSQCCQSSPQAPIVQWPRIPGSQPGDRGSNPRGGAKAPIAQLDRVAAYEAEGWRFESSWARQQGRAPRGAPAHPWRSACRHAPRGASLFMRGATDRRVGTRGLGD